MYATLIVVAALWGTATGLLLPRAAYRLSVEPADPWRDGCPAGHRFTGPARGWLGLPGCAACAAAVPVPVRTAPGPAADVAHDSGPGTEPAVGPASDTPDADPSEAPDDAPDDTSDASPDGPDATAGTPGSAAARFGGFVAVPLLTALVCAALAAATGPRPELAVWLLVTPFAVLLALVDSRVHRLPDQLTLPLAAAAAVLLGVAALIPGGAGSWPTALLGGLVLGFTYAVLFLINPNGMGFGDVKLALSLGVVLGWYGWLVLFAGAFAGFLLGAVYGFGLILLRRANRKSAIPFGPFMIVGALLAVLLGALAAV
ncbi:A24 family peptidase [Streptomyces sp. NBC_01429]|uniref:A24 family peptidase n=1 Tax=Streptomyces sp. NBC_01429 TaxID=2903862 RepID=UPI002E2D6902|nr:A24 family peptidase [Streptomyces sp. NBC_01429]